MINLSHLLHDYEASGSVNSRIQVCGFVDDTTFLTKTRALGVVYKLRGVDYEGADNTTRQDIAHRFERALRLLDEPFTVYGYIIKSRVQPFAAGDCKNPIAAEALQRRVDYLNTQELYSLDLYLVILYEGLQQPRSRLLTNPRKAIREWLSTTTAITLLEDDITRAMATLHQRAASFEIQLADSIKPTRLNKHEAYAFLRCLVNYAPHKQHIPLRYDTHIDYFISDSDVACHSRSHIEVDGYRVKVLTMKEPFSETWAHALEKLYLVPGEWIACLEWQRMSTEKARSDIKTRRRHFFNKRVSLTNYLNTSEKAPESEMLVDTGADMTVQQLGDALKQIESHYFGQCSLTFVIYDKDVRSVERSAAEAIKVLAAKDGVFFDESYNVLNAWLAIIPGNKAYNLRRLALLDTNLADLSFLFTLDSGERMNAHLGREAAMVFETNTRTPYYYNLHYYDVGNTLILGSIGSGKSTLVGVLLTHFQKYDPFTVIFDIGNSYLKMATMLGGSYLELGQPHSATRINPFACEPTSENLEFLHHFVKLLLEEKGALPLTPAQDRDVYDAIENVFQCEPEQQRLFTAANMMNRALTLRLSKWCEGGRYGYLFDNVVDSLSLQQLQVFEFGAMREYPELLEPLLFYILHRVDREIGNGLTVCVLDEAWRFIQHPVLRAYVQEALKTWRKRNASIILATQSVEDFASADLLRAVIEGCPTKMFLANPSLDKARYTELFHLNEMKRDVIASLIPRKQIALETPELFKILNLNVGIKDIAMYGAHASVREEGVA